MWRSESMTAGWASRTACVGVSRHAQRLVWWWITLLTALSPTCGFSAVEGLPPSRFYPFEEISNIRRGASLAFDPLGRIAAVQEGAYVVLNDSQWRELTDKYEERIEVEKVAVDRDGTTYYGALGSWGTLTPTSNGKLRPSSLVPSSFPKWVMSTRVEGILCQPEGIYFVGWNGIVFWDRATRRHEFYDIANVASAFALEGKIYVSAHDQPVRLLKPDDDSPVDTRTFGNKVVTHFAATGPQSAILTTSDRQILIYRAGELSRIPGLLGAELPGPVSALTPLPEGGVAISITNGGVYLVDPEGRIKLALTGAQYSRVSGLASNEPGVLWVATESGILKILHDQPFTTFGQTLGMTIVWPQVVSWKGRTIISSGGWLYEPAESAPGAPTQFQLVPDQPRGGKWGIATAGDSLLVATGEAIYVRDPGSGFRTAVPDLGGARLVAIDDSTCIVIATDHIAAVRYQNGMWSECAPRIPGVGYPSIVHRAKNSAWIELGMNRAARIRLRDDRIEARVFETFPWEQPSWVHISVVGSTVVLASVENQRLFFDELHETMIEKPELRGLFDEAPYPVIRLRSDEAGTIWGSYQHGVMTFSGKADGYAVDAMSYSALNERIPLVQTLPNGEVWVSSGSSLYLVDKTRKRALAPSFRPVLVSVRNGRTLDEILRGDQAHASLRDLSYAENSVSFDFFSGTYATLREPAYEYQLNNGTWTKVPSGSSVGLSDLSEGKYELHVRLRDTRGPIGTPETFAFVVTPPWYRTWWALAIYPLLACATMVGCVHLFVRRAEARSAALERVVAERTSELQVTMQKLQQETRISATLAERNRLAGEIHDSLEQGFTGLKLQLETTAGFANCPPEVQSGLAVALNMVAFSRNEVRNAVRDLHSPILDTADLESALAQIISQMVFTPGFATLERHGTPRQLTSTVKHHLLRIAQEAIANVMKHASANHLHVVLTFGDAAIQLEVRDDGRGFEPNAVLNDSIGHFGLRSFRGRASKIGGTVEVTSHPGSGTRIAVRVPLQNAISL